MAPDTAGAIPAPLHLRLPSRSPGDIPPPSHARRAEAGASKPEVPRPRADRGADRGGDLGRVGPAELPRRGGPWQGWRLEDVATPEAFALDPALVQRFYDARRRQLLDPAIQPNAAQLALAEVERRWPDPVLLVTQSIDDLHERAGTRSLIPMHGELLKARCLRCGAARGWSADLGVDHRCAACAARNALRPHVVWFGELPLDLDAIYQALAGCTAVRRDRHFEPDLPGRGFALAVRAAGRAHTVEPQPRAERLQLPLRGAPPWAGDRAGPALRRRAPGPRSAMSMPAPADSRSAMTTILWSTELRCLTGTQAPGTT